MLAAHENVPIEAELRKKTNDIPSVLAYNTMF